VSLIASIPNKNITTNHGQSTDLVSRAVATGHFLRVATCPLLH